MQDIVPLIGIDSSGSRYTLGSISYDDDCPFFLPVSDYKEWQGPLKFRSNCSLQSDRADGTLLQISVIGDSSMVIFKREGVQYRRFKLDPDLLPAFDNLRDIYFHQ